MAYGMNLEKYTKLSAENKERLNDWLRNTAQVKRCVKFEKLENDTYRFVLLGESLSEDGESYMPFTVTRKITKVPPVVYDLDE